MSRHDWRLLLRSYACDLILVELLHLRLVVVVGQWLISNDWFCQACGVPAEATVIEAAERWTTMVRRHGRAFIASECRRPQATKTPRAQKAEQTRWCLAIGSRQSRLRALLRA